MQPVRESAERTLGNHIWTIPSPDGRHFAIFAEVVEANVWMIDDL